MKYFVVYASLASGSLYVLHYKIYSYIIHVYS